MLKRGSLLLTDAYLSHHLVETNINTTVLFHHIHGKYAAEHNCVEDFGIIEQTFHTMRIAKEDPVVAVMMIVINH